MRIAILSNGPANYSTRRLKEEALLRGHEVRVINYSQSYVTLEKGNPVVRYRGEDLNNFDVIIPRIAASLTKYGTSVVRQFEMQGVFTTASSIAIVRARDKLRSIQLLARTGIDIPKTVFARETADLHDVIEQAGGTPLIIKVARGTHGNGVVLAETKKAAQAVMQAFYVEGVSFLVQEFIKESAGTDIRAFVVGGKVVASMQRQSLDDDFRSNIHQGGEGTSVQLTQQERRTAIKAAKAMGLPICGVDMMRSDRGPLVLEVNSSPGFAIEKVTGRNVAAKIIEYVEQNAKGKRKKTKLVPRHIGLIIIAFFVALIISLAGTISFQDSHHHAIAPASTPGKCAGLEVANQCYQLDRAVTETQREQGLSGHDNLPDKTGMLFVFDQSDRVCMWMKDMKFNLDIVWLNPQKQVTQIERNLAPSTYPQSYCQDDTKYVIELTTGEAQKLQITEGKQLTF